MIDKLYALRRMVVRHRHCWIEILRIAVGLLMIFKGYYFVENLEEIYKIIEENVALSAFVIAHYVVFAHLAGGAMMAFGILTRIAVFVQIPVVIIGAVYFSGECAAFFGPISDMHYTLLILLLLVVFLFYGSGRWSADHVILRSRKKDSEA